VSQLPWGATTVVATPYRGRVVQALRLSAAASQKAAALTATRRARRHWSAGRGAKVRFHDSGVAQHLVGRPEGNDLAHVHLSLQVDALERHVQSLEDHRARFVSPGIVKLKNGDATAMVRDADGHALLLEQSVGNE